MVAGQKREGSEKEPRQRREKNVCWRVCFKGMPDAQERLGLEIQAETSGDVAPRATCRSLNNGESAKLCVGSGLIQAVLRDTWSQSRGQDGRGRQSAWREGMWIAARCFRGEDLMPTLQQTWS